MQTPRALAERFPKTISTTVNKPLIKNKLLRGIVILAAWLLIWEIISLAIGNKYLFPGPFIVLATLFELVQTAGFLLSLASTLLRVVTGFALGMLGGTILGILTAKSGFLSSFLSPLRSLIKATPVTSFIVLVLLYMSANIAPMFIAFLMVLPISWTNVHDGIEAAPKELIEAAKVFKLSGFQTLRSVYMPALRPHLVSAATSGFGFAWKSCVAAEVIAGSKLSIGRAIYECKIYLEIPELFAWTTAIVLMSIALEKLMLALLSPSKKRAARAKARREKP